MFDVSIGDKISVRPERFLNFDGFCIVAQNENLRDSVIVANLGMNSNFSAKKLVL